MNILLLSANAFLQLPILRALDKKEYNIYMMGIGAKSTALSRFYKKQFTCKKTAEELINQINNICEQYDISTIVPVDLSFSLCISKIKDRLKYPVFPVGEPDDLMLLSNKWEMSKLLKELNIDQPNTLLVTSENNLTGEILPKPFLIKPLKQDGGKGIIKISKDVDIEAYKNTYSPYKSYPILAQDFIPGYDIDLNLVAINGVVLASTVQKWYKDWTLEFVHNEEAVSIGKAIVGHLKFSGLLHVDLRKDERTGKILVLECNPRVWGSIGASIYAGVNFIEIGILSAQNKPIPKAVGQKITFVKPYFLISRMKKNPLSFFKISQASKKDFIYTITDPIPYVLSTLGRIKRLIIQKFVKFRFVQKYLENTERLSFLTTIPIGDPTESRTPIARLRTWRPNR